MKVYEYAIILEPDEEGGAYTVTMPALPGCITQGETVEESIEMAKDAIGMKATMPLDVDEIRCRGRPLPLRPGARRARAQASHGDRVLASEAPSL